MNISRILNWDIFDYSIIKLLKTNSFFFNATNIIAMILKFLLYHTNINLIKFPASKF